MNYNSVNFLMDITCLPQTVSHFLFTQLSHLTDMASAAFIEPLPVIEFVAQLLGKDVLSRPLSDSDRVKVLFFVLDQDPLHLR
jgi:hypothetical protein